MTTTTQQAVALAREAGGTIYTTRYCKDEVAVALTNEQLERLIKLARNQALEEAKQVALGYPKYGEAVAEEIESLKDNTP